MEHHNPLISSHPSSRFITFGEVMMRLTPPNYDKIRVATNFEISYGGSEANIALALANLKVDSTFFSVVPDNSLGKSAVLTGIGQKVRRKILTYISDIFSVSHVKCLLMHVVR